MDQTSVTILGVVLSALAFAIIIALMPWIFGENPPAKATSIGDPEPISTALQPTAPAEALAEGPARVAPLSATGVSAVPPSVVTTEAPQPAAAIAKS
jgi:hypothetical protein